MLLLPSDPWNERRLSSNVPLGRPTGKVLAGKWWPGAGWRWELPGGTCTCTCWWWGAQKWSSPFDASTPWSKSSSLFCMLDTTEFITLKGSLAFRERTSSGGWRAVVTVTSNWATPISNFTCAAWLSFSVLIHVLGTAPIKAPFDHADIIPVLRSAFRHWNYFWGAPILETLR